MARIKYGYNDNGKTRSVSLTSATPPKNWFGIKGIKNWWKIDQPEQFSKTIPKKTLKVSTVPTKNLSSFARLNPNIPKETQTNEDSLTPTFNTEIPKKLSKSPNIALIGIGIIVLYFILKK